MSWLVFYVFSTHRKFCWQIRLFKEKYVLYRKFSMKEAFTSFFSKWLSHIAIPSFNFPIKFRFSLRHIDLCPWKRWKKKIIFSAKQLNIDLSYSKFNLTILPWILWTTHPIVNISHACLIAFLENCWNKTSFYWLSKGWNGGNVWFSFSLIFSVDVR